MLNDSKFAVMFPVVQSHYQVKMVLKQGAALKKQALAKARRNFTCFSSFLQERHCYSLKRCVSFGLFVCFGFLCFNNEIYAVFGVCYTAGLTKLDTVLHFHTCLILKYQTFHSLNESWLPSLIIEYYFRSWAWVASIDIDLCLSVCLPTFLLQWANTFQTECMIIQRRTYPLTCNSDFSNVWNWI